VAYRPCRIRGDVDARVPSCLRSLPYYLGRDLTEMRHHDSNGIVRIMVEPVIVMPNAEVKSGSATRCAEPRSETDRLRLPQMRPSVPLATVASHAICDRPANDRPRQCHLINPTLQHPLSLLRKLRSTGLRANRAGQGDCWTVAAAAAL